MIGRWWQLHALQRHLAVPIETLRARQQAKLRHIVAHAGRHVPYYQRMFERIGLAPEQITSIDDLRHIPVTHREDVTAAGADLHSQVIDPAQFVTATTSGTTGQPLAIVQTPSEIRLRRLLDLRALRAISLRPFDRLVGYTVRRPATVGRRQHLLYRHRWISAAQSPEQSLVALAASRPDLLWTYPSTLRALLTYTGGELAPLGGPRAIVTTAETVDAGLRDQCAAAGARHYNFYGAVEIGRIAWECPAGEGLHLNIDHLILELLPPPADVAGHTPGYGEAVITALDNTSMPLIRYRLGDLLRFANAPCSCGITLPLIDRPLGRGSDTIRLPSGRAITASALSALLMQQPGMQQFRTVQMRRGHFVITVTGRNGAVLHIEALQRAVRHLLGEPVKVECRQVDAIIVRGSKLQAFESRLCEPDSTG